MTPSFNQGEFLEETLRSVILQGYPNLEYMVLDGGSTDGSVEVIRRYAPWLSTWRSAPDRGQADAINQGLRLAGGDIWNWVNSDDLLLPGTLRRVAERFCGVDAVAGRIEEFGDGLEPRIVAPRYLHEPERVLTGSGATFVQPSVWLRRQYVQDLGGCNEAFRNAFDWDLLLRYFFHHPAIAYVDRTFTRYRLHPRSKTVAERDATYTEEIFVLAGLLADPMYFELHDACLVNLRQRYWRHTLLRMQRNRRRSRHRYAFEVLREAIHDPRVRMNRFTAGHLRRLYMQVIDE